MSNQLHITSRDIITPSTPTPPHLQTFKLSLINQIVRPDPTPVHLFFHPPTAPPSHHLIHLKRSLSTILTRFYPLAGRISNNTHIDCNDKGVVYYEARIDRSMKHFLDHPPDGALSNSLKLITPKIDDQELIMVVQVTTFSCMSVAICACISHKIADAWAFAMFLNCWGEVTRGVCGEARGVVVDSCHVFPPVDPSSLGVAAKASPNYDRESKLAIKRFIFGHEKISDLQDKLMSSAYRPSRVMALTALIWGSFIRVSQIRNRSKKRVKHVAVHAIDLRGRVEPNLPGDCLNNLIETTMGAEWEGSNPVDFTRIATLVHEDIRKNDDPEFVKRIHANGTYVDHRRELIEKSIRGEVEFFKFSSNCRVPYYETDFGWGPPCWAASAVVPMEKFCVMLDAPPASGGGVEAWVVLVEQDMEMLMRDMFFMGFVDPSCHRISRSML